MKANASVPYAAVAARSAPVAASARRTTRLSGGTRNAAPRRPSNSRPRRSAFSRMMASRSALRSSGMGRKLRVHTVRAAVTLGRVPPSSMVTLRQLWGGENSGLRNVSSA